VSHYITLTSDITYTASHIFSGVIPFWRLAIKTFDCIVTKINF